MRDFVSLLALGAWIVAWTDPHFLQVLAHLIGG
jgi:hypothetical protein